MKKLLASLAAGCVALLAVASAAGAPMATPVSLANLPSPHGGIGNPLADFLFVLGRPDPRGPMSQPDEVDFEHGGIVVYFDVPAGRALGRGDRAAEIVVTASTLGLSWTPPDAYALAKGLLPTDATPLAALAQDAGTGSWVQRFRSAAIARLMPNPELYGGQPAGTVTLVVGTDADGNATDITVSLGAVAG